MTSQKKKKKKMKKQKRKKKKTKKKQKQKKQKTKARLLMKCFSTKTSKAGEVRKIFARKNHFESCPNLTGCTYKR